jgi:hypothetical protein
VATVRFSVDQSVQFIFAAHIHHLNQIVYQAAEKQRSELSITRDQPHPCFIDVLFPAKKPEKIQQYRHRKKRCTVVA